MQTVTKSQCVQSRLYHSVPEQLANAAGKANDGRTDIKNDFNSTE